MRTSLILALSGLLLATSAHADLVIDNGAKKVAVQNQVVPHTQYSNVPQELKPEIVLGKVTQVGTPNQSVLNSVIQGWGDRVPLKDALRQIIPDGFSVMPDENLSLSKNVSWEGGQSWISLLDHMTRLYDFNVTINWNSHQISLFPVTPALAKSLAIAQRTTGLAPIHPLQPVPSKMPSNLTPSVAPLHPTASVAAYPVVANSNPVESWVLDPNKTLKENVEAWGKKAGWTVVWNAVDYNVAAKVVLHGSFSSNEGPIATLMKAYEKTKQPLLAHLTSMDHVLNITNKNYQPSEVISLGDDPNVSPMLNANRQPNRPHN